MPTLRDGTVIDESRDAVHFWTSAQCQLYYGRPRVVKSITIHHWGITGQRFDDVVNFLCSRRDSNPTSAHAVIMAKRATSIISPDNAAFHCGNAIGNAESIGLELRPEATEADYVTAAAYIAYLRGIYGDLPLKKHSDWFATACPGKWDLAKLDRMARATASTTSTSTTGGTVALSGEDKVIAYVKAIAYSGWNDDKGVQHPGFMLVNENNQQDIRALRKEVAALSEKIDKLINPSA